MGSRVLALLSRELTAAEVHYHRSCYRQYTNVSSTSAEIPNKMKTQSMKPMVMLRGGLGQIVQ